MKIAPILFLAILYTLAAGSTELRMSKNQAQAAGFRPVKKIPVTPGRIELPPNSLPWPVQFADSRHTIGNSMPQYQNYSNEAYYHEGADLRVARSQKVFAPVDGFLQGDYYTYVTDPETGEDKKYTKPFSEGGDALYFEITLRTAEGLQLEFHHVNPVELPKNIRELVLRGGGNVRKGDLLGTTAVWPTARYGERYDHIHYNLISPEGVYLNPEFFSVGLSDKVLPVIKNIFAIYKDRKVEILNNTLSGMPTELIVSAIDIKGENIYPLPPVSVSAEWGENKKVGWDFSQVLLNAVGKFPDIREVFARYLKLTDGRSFTTKGDYTNTVFLFRLKIAPNAEGPILLTVRDSSANEIRTTLQMIEAD